MVHGIIHLTDYGLIRATGDDAASFLHSQLTNDFEHLAAGRAQLAAFCSPKGRMLASFTAWKADSADIFLECDSALLPATLKRLQMFVLRAKCKLSDVSADYRIYGLAGVDVATFGFSSGNVWSVQAHESATLLRLPDAAAVQRHLLIAPADKLIDTAQALTREMSRDQWDWLQVQSAVARITAPTVEQFVPQMVNFEAVGGVNFKKGCYPGQEVVARSQYRGTLKRRMLPVHGPAPLTVGQDVYNSDDAEQPAGMVVLSAAAPNGGHDALVELRLQATEAGSLHAGSASGPMLKLGALPYDLPAQD
jgi:tRNA-modifying protein YgfZ